MTPNRLSVIVTMLFAVAAGAAVLLLGRPETAGGGSHRSPSSGGEALDAVTATAMERALGSGDPQLTSSIIASQDAASFDPAAAPKLAALHLKIQRGTFRQRTGYATVDALTTTGSWRLTLVRQGGSWKLSDTTQLQR